MFIIDGAHRLSALIAWINDDYGDRAVSRAFFKDTIEEPQIKIAQQTRDLVESRVGRYSDLKKYVVDEAGAPDDTATVRARNMAWFPFALQDVTGDVAKAERSFLKINQSATPINPTELVIIQSRRKANAIAARALIRFGTGHVYWEKFDEAIRNQIIDLSKEIFANLFRPILNYPITTLSLPAAGQALTSDSLDLVFDLINDTNGIVDSSKNKNEIKWKIRAKDRAEVDLEDDLNGHQTLEFLKAVQARTKNVFGPFVGSLALHSGVYCYGATGRFQPTAFFAAIEFTQDLFSRKKFNSFTSVRQSFEEYLVQHRYFINQIVRSYGSKTRGLPALLLLYKTLMKELQEGTDSAEITRKIKLVQELNILVEVTDEDRTFGRNFTKETKSAIYLREAMAKEIRCNICSARLQATTFSYDHVERKQDGGNGSPDNGALTHPYCNSGYKEKQHQENIGTS